MGPRTGVNAVKKRESLSSLSIIKPRFLGRPDRSLLSILTKLDFRKMISIHVSRRHTHVEPLLQSDHTNKVD
jgi:hypothetical protein